MSALEGCYDLDSWLCLAGYEPLMDVTNESLPVRLNFAQSCRCDLPMEMTYHLQQRNFFIQIDKYLEQCQGLNENE